MDNTLSCGDTQQRRSVPPMMQRRMQLLEFEGFERLTSVMETAVPLHGKCNFPTLEVTPRELVQRVRSRLVQENIKVRDIRLNGSAATHVLSHETTHNYKDLDLIFAVDLSNYAGEECEEHIPMKRSNVRHNFRSNQTRPNDQASTNRQRSVSENTTVVSRKLNPSPQIWLAKELETDMGNSLSRDRPAKLCLNDCVDEFLPASPPNENGKISPLSDVEGSQKSVLDDEGDDVTDSGYTSSGSSVSSYPVSPSNHWSFRSTLRARTQSLESSSSVASASSICGGTRKSGRMSNRTSEGRRLRFPSAKSNKEQCWKKIKDVVIRILTELLPSEMRGNADAVSDAYVQKMVKVTNDEDSWSLFSLNNDEGKNLELKFVESMQRQYEFSVDSFQVILDSYIGFKMVIRDSDAGLSSDFYPSILAESVYGDFQGALRHLHHKRICTRRPEMIRGGGLLRYCNLLVRDFTPGEVDWFEEDEDILSSAISHEEDLSPTYGTSDSKDVEHLEQLMCSRFFIDFNDFHRQQKKLSSYLDSHFVNEDDLKFNYLLTLRRVVDQNTICLMSHERTTIINYITGLAKQTLAKNIQDMAVTTAMYQPQPSTVYYQSPPSSHPSYQQVPSSQHCTVNHVNQNYGSNTTVYTYVEPVTSASEQQPQFVTQPQQEYQPCCVGTCHQCGAKQMYPSQQQQVDANNNSVYAEPVNANYNSNNNNNIPEFVPQPGYMYTQPMYNQSSEVNYAYPSPASEESQNFMLNCDAPVFPIVYCGANTQCYFSYDKQEVSE